MDRKGNKPLSNTYPKEKDHFGIPITAPLPHVNLGPVRIRKVGGYRPGHIFQARQHTVHLFQVC